eukprot:GHVU01112112.1.p1 GENE.GHVU01112112.1~~GHVU01112112.1.p1  ORF type:complete len:142 (-),score=23.56 GHVU01112112.1:251-676(-)
MWMGIVRMFVVVVVVDRVDRKVVTKVVEKMNVAIIARPTILQSVVVMVSPTLTTVTCKWPAAGVRSKFMFLIKEPVQMVVDKVVAQADHLKGAKMVDVGQQNKLFIAISYLKITLKYLEWQYKLNQELLQFGEELTCTLHG